MLDKIDESISQTSGDVIHLSFQVIYVRGE